MIIMTRRLLFSAAAADWLPSYSDAENEAVFGVNASPEPYGHNYTLDVSVKGVIDPATGILINIKEIDAIVKQKIVQILDRKFINWQVPRFEMQPPSLENIARFIVEELRAAMPAPVKLSAIRLEDLPSRYVTWQAEKPFNEQASSRSNKSDTNTDEHSDFKMVDAPRMDAQTVRKEQEAMLLTRVYEFSASHRLHSPHLSDADNRELFGKCNYDNGHGHNYEVEITVAGPIEARSGRIMDTEALDAVVNAQVIDRYDHRHFNHDIPEFAGLIPSAEVITKIIWDRLAPHLTGTARLYRVLVRETARNIFEYFGDDAAGAAAEPEIICLGKDEDVP